MAATQLSFTLCTSSSCETVHLVGSWDNYQGQLSLTKDPKKSGGWLGRFKLQGEAFKQCQRYWYYYIVDGYHVSHDPATNHTTERTTGCKLNFIDIPGRTGKTGKTDKTSKIDLSAYTTPKTGHRSRRVSTGSIPQGRCLSPERIVAPKPQRPHQTRQAINMQYDKATLEAFDCRLVQQSIARGLTPTSTSEDNSNYYNLDEDSDIASLTLGSIRSSSPDSASTVSYCCTCKRYGITRTGDRLKLDCGGAWCGYSDDSSDCSSEDEYVYEKSTRRQGVIIRTWASKSPVAFCPV